MKLGRAPTTWRILGEDGMSEDLGNIHHRQGPGVRLDGGPLTFRRDRAKLPA
jgi:hypothetical protein